MRWFALGLAVLMASLGGGLLWMANRPPDGAYIEPATRHDPTAKAASDAARLRLAVAPDFELAQVGGGRTGLSELHSAKPLVLAFIKHTCPCSIEAEPVFTAFAKRWSDVVNFAGVIDCEGDEARLYAESNLVDYALLQDASLRTMTAYKAETSLHVVVIGTDGRVVQVWPGYSKQMLGELGQVLANETKMRPRSFDAKLAPERLTAGCMFEPAKP